MATTWPRTHARNLGRQAGRQAGRHALDEHSQGSHAAKQARGCRRLLRSCMGVALRCIRRGRRGVHIYVSDQYRGTAAEAKTQCPDE